MADFWDILNSWFNDDIDTSYDVRILSSGVMFALQMKMDYGLSFTNIQSLIGKFNDYYDPHEDVIYLTFDTLDKKSVISAATACHEVGHAIAYKNGFRAKGRAAEKEATRLALEFLKTKLDDKEYAVAERFLNKMLKSYKI